MQVQVQVESAVFGVAGWVLNQDHQMKGCDVWLLGSPLTSCGVTGDNLTASTCRLRPANLCVVTPRPMFSRCWSHSANQPEKQQQQRWLLLRRLQHAVLSITCCFIGRTAGRSLGSGPPCLLQLPGGYQDNAHIRHPTRLCLLAGISGACSMGSDTSGCGDVCRPQAAARTPWGVVAGCRSACVGV
jgi:hypothetical protein